MIVPLIVAAAVLLIGCSSSKKEESDSKKSEPAAPPPAPATNRVYRRSCLTDETCPRTEREAALMDYAGAVYGEKNRVEFVSPNDSFVLTADEGDYVLKAFGKPGPSKNEIRSFLGRGSDIFLKNFGALHPMCSQEMRGDPLQFVSPQLGRGLVLYGLHGCGKNYLEQLGKSGLELSIGENPENWVFFLEGYGHENSQFIVPEMEFFKRMAGALKVPLRNAVPVRAFDKEAMKLAMKKTKYVEMDFAVAVVFQGVVGRLRAYPDADPDKLEREMADLMAPDLGQDPEETLKSLHEFLQKYPTFLEAGTESDRRILTLIEPSNQLSEERLREEIKKIAEERPNLNSLFVVGAGHKDLIRNVYAEEKK